MDAKVITESCDYPNARDYHTEVTIQYFTHRSIGRLKGPQS